MSESRGKSLRNSMMFLVGAAGFEPTTCSTQNCRATRLRYTPIFAGNGRRYTLGPPPARRCTPAPALENALPAVEQRVCHPVAGSDPVFLRRAGDHFQHALGEPARGDDLGRERLGIFGDPQDPAVGTD